MIRIPAQAVTAMFAHAAWCHPDEACGLLAGEADRVQMVYPLTNRNPSPRSYTVDPVEHFHAWRHAEGQGWELIGVFHSHPQGPAVPSLADLQRALYPEWHYVIVQGSHRLRSFRIRGGRAEEETVVRLASPPCS